MCKITIVIPICNVENYVKTCVESAMKQTLQDIEIICIDDASTDMSSKILKDCAKQDPRIKIISYDDNKSASQARKDGALAATGEYIMFLDGDDYLESNACEELYRSIKEKDVDILQFGTNVLNEGSLPERRIENLQNFLAPYPELLSGKEVFDGCFIEMKYRFTLWNKIYRASLCKKAFQSIKDGYFPKAQDLYAFFVLCYFAESYQGIENAYYNYRFGAGITGKKELSLPQLERYCHSAYIADAMEEFITQQEPVEDQYIEVAKTLRKNLLNESVNSWLTLVSPDESAKGFDIICQYWNKIELISLLCEKHYAKKKYLAEKILGAECIQFEKNHDVKTIGIFYHRYTPGGVQRVISLLIPIYMKLGYKVVLFTDEFSEENEYALPESVLRIVLPSSLTIKKSEYHKRAEAFLTAIKEHNVDVVCYQAASSQKLLFDMLLLKLYQVPVILTVHEVAFQNMLTMNPEMATRPSIYHLADFVTVLSRAEQKYWRCFGVNAIYVPNPISNQLIHRDPEQIEKNTILWVGRLDSTTKRCLEVVDIMKDVVEEIPDAKLLVVGGEYSSGILKKMEERIAKRELEHNVILCGYDTDIDSYYRRSELHILTSISETFPMAIAESKSYGMPLVMYELPFVELVRESKGKGIVSIPQGDIKMMAKSIVKILKDKEYKERLQKEAHDSLEAFLSVDPKSKWQEIFCNLGNRETYIEEDQTDSILLRSFLQHYEYGASVNKKQKDFLRKKSSDLQERIDYLEERLQNSGQQIEKLKSKKLSSNHKPGHELLYRPKAILSHLSKILKSHQ